MTGDMSNRANNVALIKKYVRENGQELHPDIGQLSDGHINRLCQRLDNSGMRIQQDGSVFVGEYRMAGRYEDLEGPAAVAYLRKDIAEIVPEWIERQETAKLEAAVKAGPSTLGNHILTAGTLRKAGEEFRILCEAHDLEPAGSIIDLVERPLSRTEIGLDGDAVEEFLREGFGGSKGGGKPKITR